jgi:hypothetical protein
MMSSVIPARLDFQCGHAALVSLPRVKGESSAERTRRIALEKSGAHARACDFCAPRLEVVAAAVVSDVVGAADLESTMAETTVVMPATTASTPEKALAPERAPTPAIALTPERAPTREGALRREGVPTPATAPTPGRAPRPKRAPVAPFATQTAAPDVVPPATGELAAALAVVAAEPTEPSKRTGPVARPARRQARRSPARARSNGHSAPPIAAAVAGQPRFVVQFEAETVLEAADIREALRLAASLGAAEVVAITRDV